MKKIVLCVLSLTLIVSSAFSLDYPTKIYPFLGYSNFHDAIDLKDNFIFGFGLNQQIEENIKIDLEAGYIPSEYISKSTALPVFYGSINGQYLLPKACCNVRPFLLAGYSMFGFDGVLDSGIEFGAGFFTLSDKNIEHKFEVKARYNPGDKQSDIIAIFSLGLFPINEKKAEPVIAKEEVKEPVKKEIPKELIMVIEEEKTIEPIVKEEPVVVAIPSIIEEPKKQEATKPLKTVFVSSKKIVMDRFYLDSITIGAPGANLARVASNILKKDAKLKTVITGYANSIENNPAQLALKRAESVKNDMINQYGISDKRIKVKSGGTKPATDYNYLNRRAEIEFYYEK